MAQPENPQSNWPYLLWLQALQNTQGGTAQTWQSAVSDLWQMPAAYWQTVAGIQAHRARLMAQIWQNAPTHLAKLAQCTSPQQFPQWLGEVMSWQGEIAAQFLTLDTATQSHRANLWKEWQHTFTRNARPEEAAPQPKPAPQAGPAKPVVKAAAPQPQPEQPRAAQPQPAPQPAPRPVVQPQPAQPKAVAQPTPPLDDYPLLNGANGHNAPSPAAMLSPTANSVVRTSAGASINAAAAARRSIVARRQSRRRLPR